MKKRLRHSLVPLLALVITLSSQLYFLNADPHPDISTSRGPFTDEGLNTCQARNFVNQGDWGLEKGDNLVKSPLYNAYLALVFTAFNTQRNTARLAVLLLSLTLWFLFLVRSGDFYGASLFLLLAGFQFHLSQFLHFSMVEAIVSFLVPLALLFGARYLSGPAASFKNLLYCFLFAYAGFLFKIQYAYLLALPFGVWLVSTFTGKKERVKHLGFLLLAVLCGGLFFYLAWFIPTREVFLRVWQHQGVSRFSALSDLWFHFKNAGKYLLWNPYNFWFAVSFLISIPVGVYSLLKTKHSLSKYLLTMAGIWVLLEVPKAFILFLPTRYALTLFAAQAFWMAAVFSTYLRPGRRKPLLTTGKYVLLLFMVPALVSHLFNQQKLIESRSLESQRIIDHFNRFDFKNQVIGGVWATSLLWNPTAEVIPVWKNFLNDHNFILSYDPPLVVTEKEEADSERVFLSRGIILRELSIRTETFWYGPHQVAFYQLKPIGLLPGQSY